MPCIDERVSGASPGSAHQPVLPCHDIDMNDRVSAKSIDYSKQAASTRPDASEIFPGASCLAQPKRLAIIGGCHVAGYLVGTESSFATLISSPEYEVNKFAYMNTGSQSKIQDALDHQAFDSVFFQLGNYECPPSKSKKKTKGSKLSNSATQVKAPLFSPRTKYLFKRVIHPLLQLAGKDISMRKNFRLEYSNRIEEAKQSGCKQIVLLSPFPSRDKWTRFCRARASRLIRALAIQTGVEYLDIWDSISSTMYADDFHLNELGHQQVANRIKLHLATLAK